MKLGLLVVLAVAVLVPSLSESRTVSKCELRKKLGERLVLPKFEDTVLKVVICNLKWRTHLKTNKIRVLGHRVKKPTTTTRPVTTNPVNATQVTTEPVTMNPVNATPVTTRPVTNRSVTTRPVTTRQVTTRPVTTRPTATESTTAEPTTTESMAANPVATSSITARATGTTSNQTNSVSGNKRRKRDVDAASEESDSENTGGSLEDMLNEEQVKFDEEQLWQDDNKMDDEDNENDEGVEEPEPEDGGKRKKRSLLRRKSRGRRVQTWSLGYYGVFALTDSHFCDSGYRWSRNLCKTDCSAFTDEDISDDCDCVVKTHYWLPLFWSAPRWCRRVSNKRFFSGCD